MTTGAWSCPSCNTPCATTALYCSTCGERRLPAPNARATATRWLNTLRALVFQPGRLTADYRDGRRQPWIAPLSLFLTINLIFFIGQSLTGLNVLSIPLESHLTQQNYSEPAQRILARRLEARPIDRARFDDRFQLQQETLSKATAIAMVPLLALASWLLFLPRSTALPWRTHLVYALHFYAFMLLFLTVFFALLAPALLAWRALGLPFAPAMLDNVASTFEAGAIVVYHFVASGRVYGGPAWRRLLAACCLVVAVLVALYLHRFAIFAITTWTA